MHIFRFTSLLIVALSLFISCNIGYKKTSSGIEYRYLKKGSGQVAQDGYFLKVHVMRYLGDSLAQDTHKEKEELIPFKKDFGKGQKFNLNEILSIAKKDDSILMRVPMDSIFKNQTTKPPFYKKGAYIKIILIIKESSLLHNNKNKTTTKDNPSLTNSPNKQKKTNPPSKNL